MFVGYLGLKKYKVKKDSAGQIYRNKEIPLEQSWRNLCPYFLTMFIKD